MIIDLDKVVYDEDPVEFHSAWSYVTGQIVGLEEAAGMLMKEATRAFQLGQDTKAQEYRNIVNDIKQTLKGREHQRRGFIAESMRRLSKEKKI